MCLAMICRNRRPISVGRRRKEVAAEMPSPQTPDGVGEAGQHQRPCRLKMEIAAPSILVRQHVPVASRHHCARRRNWYLEKRGGLHVADFTPIKTGMRDQDFNSGDEEGKEGDRRDPVRHANEWSMAGRVRILERSRVGHVGRIPYQFQTTIFELFCCCPTAPRLFFSNLLSESESRSGVNECNGDFSPTTSEPTFRT